MNKSWFSITRILIGLGIGVLLLLVIAWRLNREAELSERCKQQYGPEYGYVLINGRGLCIEGVKDLN